jgi:hypothetical protein
MTFFCRLPFKVTIDFRGEEVNLNQIMDKQTRMKIRKIPSPETGRGVVEVLISRISPSPHWGEGQG